MDQSREVVCHTQIDEQMNREQMVDLHRLDRSRPDREATASLQLYQPTTRFLSGLFNQLFLAQ